MGCNAGKATYTQGPYQATYDTASPVGTYATVAHPNSQSDQYLGVQSEGIGQPSYGYLNNPSQVALSSRMASRGDVNDTNSDNVMMNQGEPGKLSTLPFTPSDRELSEMRFPQDSVSIGSRDGVQFLVGAGLTPDPNSNTRHFGYAPGKIQEVNQPSSDLSNSLTQGGATGLLQNVWVQQDQSQDTNLEELLAAAVALRTQEHFLASKDPSGDAFIKLMENQREIFDKIQIHLKRLLFHGNEKIDIKLCLIESTLKELTLLDAFLKGSDPNGVGVVFKKDPLEPQEIYESLDSLVTRHKKELTDADTECAHKFLDLGQNLDEDKVKSLVEEHLQLKQFIRTRQQTEKRKEQVRIQVKIKERKALAKAYFVPLKVGVSVSEMHDDGHRLLAIGGPSPPIANGHAGVAIATDVVLPTKQADDVKTTLIREEHHLNDTRDEILAAPEWDTHSHDGNPDELLDQYQSFITQNDDTDDDRFELNDEQNFRPLSMYEDASDDDDELLEIFRASSELDTTIAQDIMSHSENLNPDVIKTLLTLYRSVQEDLLLTKDSEEKPGVSLWHQAVEKIKDQKILIRPEADENSSSTQTKVSQGESLSTQTTLPMDNCVSAQTDKDVSSVSVGTDAMARGLGVDAEVQTMLNDDYFHDVEESKRIQKADKGLAKAIRENPNMSEEELNQLLKDHHDKINKIRSKREAERLKMLELLDKKKKKVRDVSVSEEDERLKTQQENIRDEYLKELSRRRTELSESEMKALLSKMRKEQGKIQELRNLEKLRNNQALAEKLSNRAKKNCDSTLETTSEVTKQIATASAVALSVDHGTGTLPISKDTAPVGGQTFETVKELDTEFYEELLKKQRAHELNESLLTDMLQDHSSRVDKLMRMRGAEAEGASQQLKDKIMQKKLKYRSRENHLLNQLKQAQEEEEEERTVLAKNLIERVPETNKKIKGVREMEKEKTKAKLEERKRQLRKMRQSSRTEVLGDSTPIAS